MKSALLAILLWISMSGFVTAQSPDDRTFYVYSHSGQLLAEYDANGQCIREYIYLRNELIAEFRPLDGPDGKMYYYVSDQVNSTRVLTDEGGNRVYAASYGPYGDLQKTWEKDTEPNPGFSGKERDEVSSMDYFGARYYDHRQARFTSVDPVRNRDRELVDLQSWNLYAYANNSPVTIFDPDGRNPAFIKFTADVMQGLSDGPPPNTPGGWVGAAIGYAYQYITGESFYQTIFSKKQKLSLTKTSPREEGDYFIAYFHPLYNEIMRLEETILDLRGEMNLMKRADKIKHIGQLNELHGQLNDLINCVSPDFREKILLALEKQGLVEHRDKSRKSFEYFYYD